MGNAYSPTYSSKQLPSSLILKNNTELGRSRYFQTYSFSKRDEKFVIKLFFKDARIDVSEKIQKLKELKKKAHFSHLGSIYECGEEKDCVYYIRSYYFCNLNERINTRPFLSGIEKKWISYQLLIYLKFAQTAGVVHGDLKPENIMLDKNNWIHIVDNSSAYKPVNVSDKHPGEFRDFFVVGPAHLRGYYTAPERFSSKNSYTKLTHQMDVFSIGCIIAELWTEKYFFTFAKLVNYSKSPSTVDISQSIDAIGDPNVREMVLNMINANPEERWTGEQAIRYSRKLWIPSYFPFLHFLTQINQLSSETTVYYLSRSISLLKDLFGSKPRPTIVNTNYYSYIENSFNNDYFSESENEDLQICNRDESTQNEGYELILDCIIHTIHHLKDHAAQLMVLDSIHYISEFVDDRVRLQSMIPHLVSLFESEDQPSIIRAQAIKTLAHVLSLITSFSFPEDARLFHSTILPSIGFLFKRLEELKKKNISECVDDSDLIISTLAECLASLASSALKFVNLGLEYQKKFSDFKNLKFSSQNEIDYLKSFFSDAVLIILTQKSIRVKQKLVEKIVFLCDFIGPIFTENSVLPILLSFLSTKKKSEPALWLSYSIWSCWSDIIRCTENSRVIAQMTLSMLPCAIYCESEFVVIGSIKCIAQIVDLLSKQQIYEFIETISPLLLHSNSWVRCSVMETIMSARETMQDEEVQLFLIPRIQKFFCCPVSELARADVLRLLKGPISEKSLNLVLKKYIPRTVRKIVTYVSQLPEELKRDIFSDMYVDDKKGDNVKPVLYPRSIDKRTRHFKIKDLQCWKGEKTVDICDHRRSPAMESASDSPNGVKLGDYRDELFDSVESFTFDRDDIDIPFSLFLFNLDLSKNEKELLFLMRHLVKNASEFRRRKDVVTSNPTPRSIQSSEAMIGSYSPSFSEIHPNGVASSWQDIIGDIRKEINFLNFVSTRTTNSKVDVEPPSKTKTRWKPNNILTYKIRAHDSSITQISVHPSKKYLLSSSMDGLFKFYQLDISSLQYCSKYESEKGLTSFLLANEYAIVGDDDGCLHQICLKDFSLFSMEKENSNAILKLEPYDESVIVYGTSASEIVSRDLRMPRSSWKLSLDHVELITSLLVSSAQSMIVSGTHMGILSVCDVRMRRVSTEWRFSDKMKIGAMSWNHPCVNKLVWTCTGYESFGLWNLETAKCLKLLSVNGDVESELMEELNAVVDCNSRQRSFIDEGCTRPQKRPSYFSCVDMDQNGSFVLTGAANGIVRYWDLDEIQRSCLLAGSEKNLNPTYCELFGSAMAVYQEKGGTIRAENSACEVTDVKYVDSSPALIIGAHADGNIKIWK